MAIGYKTGGRKKGVKNHLTQDVRKTFELVFKRLAPKAELWIRKAGKKDPARGADLLLRLAEHFVPKLSRQEVEEKKTKTVNIQIVRRVGEGKDARVVEIKRLAATTEGEANQAVQEQVEEASRDDEEVH